MSKASFLIAWILVFGLSAADNPATEAPKYTADGQLARPESYREWVYVTSGLGMTYNAAGSSTASPPAFDNVFVTRAAYKSFLETGRWPDKTMFVLEVRSSESKASINKGGRFQTGLVAIDVEVKDESRFPGKWAFFGFNKDATLAKPLSADAACYSCHAQKGAVDNTFVQFYPTLLPIAKTKGTFKNVSE